MYVIRVQRILSFSITLFIGFAYAHATLKYTPSFSYPSRSCICQTLTYHIIMPCLSNCLFNTFIDPLLTFYSPRPSNNCLELPAVFFFVFSEHLICKVVSHSILKIWCRFIVAHRLQIGINCLMCSNYVSWFSLRYDETGHGFWSG